MKLSVVVTVYNLARYIDATLESVLAQSHDDIEVIVVDDRSTDESVERLERHGNRIVLLQQPRNGGVLRATMAGLERASGDVVCFLDGDDLWEPTKLARVAERFSTDSRLVVCSHDCSVIDGDGAFVRKADPTQAPTRARSGDPRALSAGMRRSILEYRGEVWLGSAWSIRNAALDRHELARWFESLPRPELVYQDHPLATFLLLTNPDARLDWIDEALLRYRVHGTNYSGAARDLGRARAIADKGWETRNATRELVARYAPHDAALNARQALTLREYDYLRSLYDHRLLDAARAFFDCARGVWPTRQLPKEAARLALVSALGPARFFSLRGRS